MMCWKHDDDCGSLPIEVALPRRAGKKFLLTVSASRRQRDWLDRAAHVAGTDDAATTTRLHVKTTPDRNVVVLVPLYKERNVELNVRLVRHQAAYIY